MSNNSHIHTPLLILGSGPAGYTAAIYAARANLKPKIILGSQPGGQMTITTDVENYPGFVDTIQGPWLMEQMQKQAERYGTEMIQDYITKVELSKKPFTCKSSSGTTYSCDALIICTGAQARWLNLESEKKFQGFGVSACATCDGFFFRNKKVAVVGGGNTAVEETMFMTNFATEVILIHRRDQLRAEKISQDRLFKNPKVKVLWDHIVKEVKGQDDPKYVTGLVVENVKTKAHTNLDIDGLFIAIGHEPATQLFKDQLDMDESGYIITKPDSTQTNVSGVFAAGDVKDKVYRQAVTAAGMGCMAALEADKYLAQLNN